MSVSGALASRRAIRQFDDAVAVARKEPVRRVLPSTVADFSVWSPQRVAAYRAGLLEHSAPLGVLHLEKLGLRVPVFEGTGELNLNNGVGWIGGTAKPGEYGNVGIAGHRDGFFRGLKNISIGDSIEISTVELTTRYRVDQIEIVQPENIGVLEARQNSSVTLVTCYPFYFIGNAPQRFIVHGVLMEQVRYD